MSNGVDTPSEILAESQRVKQDADRLLEESKVVEILSKYGKVELTGSYAAGVMLAPDIDMNVIVEELDREVAIQAITDLMSNTRLTGYMFFDWVAYRNPKFPVGFCLGVKQKMEGYDSQWKMDIWFITEQRSEAKQYMSLLADISLPQRELIVECKKYLLSQGIDFMSAKVYDAVCKDGIKSVEEFQEYFKTEA